MIFNKIEATINKVDIKSIDELRKIVLNPLINYIQEKALKKEVIRLNFICTHNSRRSHLTQVWAQAMALHFKINNVFCYSGGTEATALYPMVAKTLEETGFLIQKLSDEENSIYSIKFSENEHPVIGFSKTYDHSFNPSSHFAAIMTCSHADDGCPFIAGAEKRIPITYNDPKVSDNAPNQTEVYYNRSMQIATEMYYIFSQIKS